MIPFYESNRDESSTMARLVGLPVVWVDLVIHILRCNLHAMEWNSLSVVSQCRRC